MNAPGKLRGNPRKNGKVRELALGPRSQQGACSPLTTAMGGSPKTRSRTDSIAPVAPACSCTHCAVVPAENGDCWARLHQTCTHRQGCARSNALALCHLAPLQQSLLLYALPLTTCARALATASTGPHSRTLAGRPLQPAPSSAPQRVSAALSEPLEAATELVANTSSSPLFRWPSLRASLISLLRRGRAEAEGV